MAGGVSGGVGESAPPVLESPASLEKLLCASLPLAERGRWSPVAALARRLSERRPVKLRLIALRLEGDRARGGGLRIILLSFRSLLDAVMEEEEERGQLSRVRFPPLPPPSNRSRPSLHLRPCHGATAAGHPWRARCACVRACACACVRACMRACARLRPVITS